jgi:hypothetical protein
MNIIIGKGTNMNRVQKMAWWTLGWAAIALVSSGIAMAVIYSVWGFPKAYSGMAAWGLFGFASLGPGIYRKDKGTITADERDRIINQRAALAAFTLSYLVMGLACMTPYFVLGYRALVPVFWLPEIFMAGGFTCFIAHSIAILIQYGSDSRQEDNA